jgi:hypothetical protein
MVPTNLQAVTVADMLGAVVEWSCCANALKVLLQGAVAVAVAVCGCWWVLLAISLHVQCAAVVN